MELKIALSVAVFFQFLAFAITISLIPKTKFKIAWISISIGFLLMAVRRLTELYFVFKELFPSRVMVLNGWIAVAISLAMLVSSIYIREIFEFLNRIQKLQKMNEAKLLTAIISTEEKERLSFSKELHDGLGPILSSAKMTISAIDRKGISLQNSKLMDNVENNVDYAIVATKEISNNLTPNVLERYGLRTAIETFIRNLGLSKKIEIKNEINFKKQPNRNNIEVILYRICCELINNTVKYASASKISIIIICTDEKIEFNYDDNGVGFNIEEKEYLGMGLTNMRSRVKSLNGSIELFSSPNRGFCAYIKLPL
jgi:signal transduction histidine kinase